MEECFICFETCGQMPIDQLRGYVRNCSCRIIAHEQCLRRWVAVQESCPLCRAVIYNTDIPYILKIYIGMIIIYGFGTVMLGYIRPNRS